MFLTDEFLKVAFFGALIGGIITVVLLKLWKKKRAAQGKTGLELRKTLKSVQQNMMNDLDNYSKWVSLKFI